MFISCSGTLVQDTSYHRTIASQIITDTNGVKHLYLTPLLEDEDMWCTTHQQYEKIRVYEKVENN